MHFAGSTERPRPKIIPTLKQREAIRVIKAGKRYVLGKMEARSMPLDSRNIGRVAQPNEPIDER